MEGRGPKQIANQLKADKVLTPASYKALQGIKSPNKKPEDPYDWKSSTVVAILERREYTGCTVNFKTYTNSIWDKKQRDNPIEKQAIFPNTHERIIDDDVFEKVQEIRQQRHRMIRTEEAAFSLGSSTARTAAPKCCTVHPTTAISIRTSLTALCTASTKRNAMGISSVSKSWNDWFSSTFRRLWGISCAMRIISARLWRNSSTWKAVSKSASEESVWRATSGALPS